MFIHMGKVATYPGLASWDHAVIFVLSLHLLSLHQSLSIPLKDSLNCSVPIFLDLGEEDEINYIVDKKWLVIPTHCKAC